MRKGHALRLGSLSIPHQKQAASKFFGKLLHEAHHTLPEGDLKHNFTTAIKAIESHAHHAIDAGKNLMPEDSQLDTHQLIAHLHETQSEHTKAALAACHKVLSDKSRYQSCRQEFLRKIIQNAQNGMSIFGVISTALGGICSLFLKAMIYSENAIVRAALSKMTGRPAESYNTPPITLGEVKGAAESYLPAWVLPALCLSTLCFAYYAYTYYHHSKLGKNLEGVLEFAERLDSALSQNPSSLTASFAEHPVMQQGREQVI